MKNQRPKTKDQRPIFAKKSFGQNFLVDGNYIEKIITELNPQTDETIIEIGAGRGALTKRLVEKAGNVIAIELDKDLIPILLEEFKENNNFQLIEADALKIDFAEILQRTEDKGQRTKLVANLPYYISTAILQKLIEQRECFSELVLMLQREVVERITAEAGNTERGYLSVLVEAYTQAEKLFDVPPTAFRPVPKVWSAVVKLQIKNVRPITIGEGDDKLFWRIVSAGFAQKRKTILNNLKNAPTSLLANLSARGNLSQILEAVEIESSRRAETLTLEEWLRLFKAITH